MNSHEIKLKTRKFIKEFDVRELNYETLKSIIERQGYIIVEYSHISNDENVTLLINALKLTENINRSKGFTYADQNHRIVFVHKDLSDDEKLFVLSHEEGHIYLGHMTSSSIFGRDVQEEHAANEFSHYLLNQGKCEKTAAWIRRHKVISILSVLLIVCIAVAVLFIPRIATVKNYYGEYYITRTGNKYHKKDCVYVKDKTNTHRMTIEEFESGEFEPCKICLPDE